MNTDGRVNVRRGIVLARVETRPCGSFDVRWEVEGVPVAVDVGLGWAPDGADHHHVTTVPPGQTSVRVHAPADACPRFVSLTPREGGARVIAADRRVPFAGISNFRDLGGYPTRSGAPVRWGLVFRSGVIGDLRSADRALYERLRIRMVFDLRADAEYRRRPSAVSTRRIVIARRPPDGDRGTRHEPSPRTTADGERRLFEMYSGVIDSCATEIGKLFGALATEALPALFHCHAGKDRTGVIAALLLESLGVDRRVVLDDYELTSRYLPRAHQNVLFERLLVQGYSDEAAAAVLTTSRDAMSRALGRLDTGYGGIDRYLTRRAGVRDEDLVQLRRRLLVPEQ